MNTDRLCSVLDLVIEDIQENTLLAKFEHLLSALQGASTGPQPEATRRFRDVYSDLMDSLRASPVSDSTPTQRRILDQIGASSLLGGGLASSIETIVQDNNVTPAGASDALRPLFGNLKQLSDSVSQARESLEGLGCESDELAPDEAEVGFKLPDGSIETTLEDLAKHARELNWILKAFVEVVGEDAGSLNIRALSSSTPQFFIVTVPAAALLIAKVVHKIVLIYKDVLEIREHKAGLRRMSAPKQVTLPLEKYEASFAEDALRRHAEELFKEHANVSDPARRNELKNLMTKAVLHLAKAIDVGASIEVRVALPEPPDEGEEEGEKDLSPKELKARKKRLQVAHEINQSGRALAMLGEGQRGTLMLPHSDEAEEDVEEGLEELQSN